jgi:hypothetical protein
MLARNIARCEEDYHKERERALSDYSTKVKRSVEDHLDYLNQNYPFNGTCFDKLQRIVLKQLQLVVAGQDFRHKAFEQLRYGRIDWLAEPFFEGENLVLSLLTQEYDRHRRDQSYQPSFSCKKLFYIYEPVVYEAPEPAHEESTKRKREDEWD